MKLNVKTLKGTSFEIEAAPEASVGEVKRIIESAQGQNVYPADQQMLIYQGKILKDDTTLEANNVAANSFLVIMLSKAKPSSSGASTASKAPVSQSQTATPVAASTPSVPVASAARSPPSQAPVAASEPAPPSAKMKLNVKTLKGTSFEIEVTPEASVGEVKRIIESAQGQNVYPADQQVLIYQGKILKDDTTLEANNVAENSFLVIVRNKIEVSS